MFAYLFEYCRFIAEYFQLLRTRLQVRFMLKLQVFQRT